MFRKGDAVILVRQVPVQTGVIHKGETATVSDIFDNGFIKIEINGYKNYNIAVQQDDVVFDEKQCIVHDRRLKSKEFRVNDEVLIHTSDVNTGIVTRINDEGMVVVKTNNISPDATEICFEPSNLTIVKRKYGEVYFPYSKDGFEYEISRQIYKENFPVIVYRDYVVIKKKWI